MKRSVAYMAILLLLVPAARGAVELSAKGQKIQSAGAPVAARQIAGSLPDRGTFYHMSIGPGSKGYPAATIAFDKPVDFSGSDVLGVWFKTDRPISFFQLVLNSSNGVAQELNLAGYAAGFSSRVMPGQWCFALLPYQLEPGWIRFGEKLDYTRIKNVLFYTDAQTLPANATVHYEFGGMKLYSREEAKQLAALHILPIAPKTAVKLLRDKDMLVWSVDPSEKILRTTALPSTAPEAPYARANAAGHEYASYLLVIQPARPIEKLSISATDLVGGKASIPAANVTLRYVDSIHGTLLDYPDPLPLVKGAASVAARDNFMLWVTIYVPPDTPRGAYQGKIVLRDAHGMKETVGLALAVSGFSLPRQTHLKSVFTVQFFYGGLANFERSYLSHWPPGVKPFNAAYKVMIDNILEDFGEHRITPELFAQQFNHLTLQQKIELTKRYQFDPPFSLGYNTVMSYLVLKDGKWVPMEVTEAKRRQMREDLARRANELRAKGLSDRSFLKVGDEPTAEWMDAMRMAAEDAARAIPHIQRFVALGDWPESRFVSPLFGKVNTWCMQWGRFDFLGPEAMARKAAGDKLWAYAAEYKANNGYQPMDLRAPFWLYWKYGISGVHYSHHIPAIFLTYPNMTYPHSDGLAPIPSIRWEMIRHGIQDYEYLWLLNDLIGTSPERGRPYRRLLEVPRDVAADELTYASEPTALLQRRAEIAKAIEELSQ